MFHVKHRKPFTEQTTELRGHGPTGLFHVKHFPVLRPTGTSTVAAPDSARSDKTPFLVPMEFADGADVSRETPG